MRIHHLNCGTMCPVGGKLLPSVLPAEVICHCLLIEAPNGLVLVDAGLGDHDLKDPTRLGAMRHLLNASGDRGEAAVNQVKALGFDPSDVRHVVLTHMDLDHAGGVADFPHATVHVWIDELEAARARSSITDKSRYRPAQWDLHANWRTHQLADGEGWNGFEAVRDIEGLPPELLLVPLPGHSAGHMGVAVDTGERWLFHCGDAFYDGREIRGERANPGLALFQRLSNLDPRLAAHNRQRVYELGRTRDDVDVFCAHDPAALRHFTGNPDLR